MISNMGPLKSHVKAVNQAIVPSYSSVLRSGELSLRPCVSAEFAGVYEALPPCCWSEDSQRVVFSSAYRNRKVESLVWAAH